MHQAFTSRNGARFLGARGRTIPSDTRNPWLKQVFDEQDRLHITASTLSKMSGVDVRTINRLRRSIAGGKEPAWSIVIRLAEAMDFRIPEKLTKNGD